MSYSAEFIEGLPQHIRREVANMNEELKRLEAEVAKLRLPKGLVASEALIEQNQQKAWALVDAADKQAETIINEATTEAKKIKDSAAAFKVQALAEVGEKFSKLADAKKELIAEDQKLKQKFAEFEQAKALFTKTVADFDVVRQDIKHALQVVTAVSAKL